MQKLGRKIIAAILGWQVRRLQNKNQFKVIAVAGSIGKTSTKLAIANVLKQRFRVRYQDGNYNDLVSVPLIYFGRSMPRLYNPIAWLWLIIKNEATIRKKYPYDVVLIELGPDGPSQMSQFKSYVNAEIGVLTAISPEHMEFFGDIEAVAQEEMVLAELCDKLIYNSDLVDKKYLSDIKIQALSYSRKEVGDAKGQALISDLQLYSRAAATTVGRLLGMSQAEVDKGLSNIEAVSGRMQQLAGINNSLIIDDSYNASPRATMAALDALYMLPNRPKIALLGNMNELGDYSKQAHEEIGRYCDAKKLDLVVTLGPDANKYLAPAAEVKGCKVVSFDSPYKAGEYIKSQIKSGAVVLVKGSQNRVFAEEAIKSLLANPADNQKLVRQSPEWLKLKAKAFGRS